MLKICLTLVSAAALFVGAPAQAQDYLRADEDRVHAMVNATRAARGLRPLDRVEGLVQVARQQSVRMVEENKLYHNPHLGPDLDALGLDWHWSGENVGVGPAVDVIEEAFLGSPPHYENIVRPEYTAMGVGVVSTGKGYVYVTQVFAQLGGAAAPATPPQAPAAPPPPTVAPPPPPPPTSPPTPPPTPVPTPARPDPVAIVGGVIVETPVPAAEVAEPSLSKRFADVLQGVLGLRP